jgi:hypothetical protein
MMRYGPVAPPVDPLVGWLVELPLEPVDVALVVTLQLATTEVHRSSAPISRAATVPRAKVRVRANSFPAFTTSGVIVGTPSR